MAADENQKTPDIAERSGEKMSEDEIDRNLMESFPASDPPSWTLGIDHEQESPTPATGQPARNKST
jgi:hypothetical protein